MPALDLLDRNIKIEHLEGYLYGLQEIENYIISSQGSTREYSIDNLNPSEGKSDSELMVETLLERIKYNQEITFAIKENFNSKIKSLVIIDWKNELRTSLKRWFVDKHLSEKNVRIGAMNYMNKFDDWTNEQKEKFTLNFEEIERETRKRLESQNKSINVFIEMIEVFMDFDFTFKKFDLSDIKEQSAYYPHAMWIYWGMDLDLFLLKNKDKNILLHFGQLLD